MIVNATLRPLRILYVDTESVWRGGQEQLYGLMTGMKARGHRVTLAAPAVAPLFQKASNDGFEVVAFHQRYELSVTAALRVCEILRRDLFDILHSNTPRSLISVGLAARWAKVPAVVCSRRVNFPLRRRSSAWKYNWSTDRILTVSASIMETLTNAGVNSSIVEVVYEGVDLEWLDKQYTTEIEQPGHVSVVGTVAHMSPEKGHSELLDAIAILGYRVPNARFYFVGEGPLRTDLESKARRLGIDHRVTFTGFRSDSEALMKQFSVFCLPSLSEGLSSAILAAMASRLPVVSTAVGGIPELVVDKETGFLVPPRSPEELAAALGVLLEDPPLRHRMGEAGRKRIEENFTVERKLDATEFSYRRLLDTKGVR